MICFLLFLSILSVKSQSDCWIVHPTGNCSDPCISSLVSNLDSSCITNWTVNCVNLAHKNFFYSSCPFLYGDLDPIQDQSQNITYNTDYYFAGYYLQNGPNSTLEVTDDFQVPEGIEYSISGYQTFGTFGNQTGRQAVLSWNIEIYAAVTIPTDLYPGPKPGQPLYQFFNSTPENTISADFPLFRFDPPLVFSAGIYFISIYPTINLTHSFGPWVNEAAWRKLFINTSILTNGSQIGADMYVRDRNDITCCFLTSWLPMSPINGPALETAYILFGSASQLKKEEPSSDGNEEKNSTGLILGLVLGLVCCCCLVLLIFGGIYLLRRKPKEDNFMREELNPELFLKEVSIGKMIGSGNFGAVYEAKWLETQIAVKKLNSSSSYDQFWGEFQILKNIRHVHVIQFLGLFRRESDNLYLCFEYADGGNLLNYLQTNDRITSSDLVRYGKEVLLGMIYLHSQNIIHRDLSCRNVLLVREVCKISDFGLSRMTEENYKSEKKEFPIRWTAPEAISLGIYSKKSDVYSYGICLWEILTRGGVPYASLNNSEVIAAVKNRQLLEIPRESPDFLQKILTLCWKYSPEERPDFISLIEMFPTVSYRSSDSSRTEILNSLSVIPCENLSVSESTMRTIYN